jgi:hypothetical protein
MEDRRSTTDGSSSGDSDEALRTQLQYTTEWIRHLLGLLVQACGFFIAADALLTGYGIVQRKAVFLLLGSLSIVGVGVISWLLHRTMIPANSVALYLERRLFGPSAVALISSTLQMTDRALHDRLLAANERPEKNAWSSFGRRCPCGVS